MRFDRAGQTNRLACRLHLKSRAADGGERSQQLFDCGRKASLLQRHAAHLANGAARLLASPPQQAQSKPERLRGIGLTVRQFSCRSVEQHRHADELLLDQRLAPAALLASGFEHQQPSVQQIVDDLLQPVTRMP